MQQQKIVSFIFPDDNLIAKEMNIILIKLS